MSFSLPHRKKTGAQTRPSRTSTTSTRKRSLAKQLEATATTLQPKSYESKSFWERWTPSWFQKGTEAVSTVASQIATATGQTLAAIPVLQIECEDAKKWIGGVEILLDKVRQVQTAIQSNAFIYRDDEFNQLLTSLYQRLQTYAEVLVQVNTQAMKLQQKGCITVETLLGLQEIEKTVNKLWFGIYNGIGYTLQTAMAENVNRVRNAARVVSSFNVTTQSPDSQRLIIAAPTPSPSKTEQGSDAFASVPSITSRRTQTVSSLKPTQREVVFAPPTATGSAPSSSQTFVNPADIFGI